MPPESLTFVRDVDHALELILQFTRGKSHDDYLHDELLRAAVERQFITVGEACQQGRRKDPSLLQSITEMQRIIDFRNVMVHGYGVIDNDIVWGVVQKNVRTLKQEVAAILAKED